jgi:hypothetical protein
MFRALLFIFLFDIVGAIAFGLLGPLIVHGADAQKAAITFVMLVCTILGFWFGVRGKKKQ